MPGGTYGSGTYGSGTYGNLGSTITLAPPLVPVEQVIRVRGFLSGLRASQSRTAARLRPAQVSPRLAEAVS